MGDLVSIEDNRAFYEQEAILKRNAAQHGTARHACTRSQLSACPNCKSKKKVEGWIEGKVLIMICTGCATRGLRELD